MPSRNLTTIDLTCPIAYCLSLTKAFFDNVPFTVTPKTLPAKCSATSMLVRFLSLVTMELKPSSSHLSENAPFIDTLYLTDPPANSGFFVWGFLIEIGRAHV